LGLQYIGCIKIIDIPDFGIFLDGMLVIKNKRGLKGVAVYHNCQQTDQKYRQPVTPSGVQAEDAPFFDTG
jgi:hypothetical protein